MSMNSNSAKKFDISHTHSLDSCVCVCAHLQPIINVCVDMVNVSSAICLWTMSREEKIIVTILQRVLRVV